MQSQFFQPEFSRSAGIAVRQSSASQSIASISDKQASTSEKFIGMVLLEGSHDFATWSINPRPIRVMVIAGGRSGEHEVSLSSARSIISASSTLPNFSFSVQVITHEGRWLSEKDSFRVLDAEGSYCDGHPPHPPIPLSHLTEQCDVVFPIIHGPFGEDGTLQGFLEIIDIPYVGCRVLASALCKEKAMAKQVLRTNDIPLVKHILVTRDSYKQNPTAALQHAFQLDGPWFVKPANLGSSIGVSKVTEESALPKAIEEALEYDRRVLVEEAVANVRELEVAVLGNHAPQTSSVGEVIYAAEFYDYKTKYSGDKTHFQIPADLPEIVAAKVEALALEVYQLLDCSGFARVDFFYDNITGAIYFNEINTFPKFARESMFARLWEARGVSYLQLIEKVVNLALENRSLKGFRMKGIEFDSCTENCCGTVGARALHIS
jgi:D-alanine-D-alanine ligase